MRLENRPPAEGINSSTENPLKELAWLLGGSLAVVVALVFAVSLAAQWIAPRVPYKYEARLARSRCRRSRRHPIPTRAEPCSANCRHWPTGSPRT